MKSRKLVRKAGLVVLLGALSLLTAPPAGASLVRDGCGVCGDSCFSVLVGCLGICGGVYNGCIDEPCLAENGAYYPWGTDCS